jgi:hypothetical protein
MGDRARSDVLKLFATGTAVTGALMALGWFLDERLHLPDRWWRFVMGHLMILGWVVWYVKPLLKTLTPVLLLVGWLVIHLLIAAVAVQSGIANINVFVLVPFEAFVLVLVLKQLNRHHRRKA